MDDSLLYQDLPAGRLSQKLGSDNGEEYIKNFIKQKLGSEGETLNKFLNIEKCGRKKLRTPRKSANLRKKRVLSNADKKQMKLYDIPATQQKYKLYEPLHQLWLSYMRDCLRLPPISSQALGVKLLKCDLHGSSIKVTKSTCPTYVGTCGILLQETKNTFKVITQDDKLKTIPKVNCEFTFVVDELVVTIHGQHFRLKSSERSLKGKLKDRITIDM